MELCSSLLKQMMKDDARMHRVVCNRCKARGHFGRDGPSKNQDPETLEADTVEARAEATRARERGAMVNFHNDVLERQRPRVHSEVQSPPRPVT